MADLPQPLEDEAEPPLFTTKPPVNGAAPAQRPPPLTSEQQTESMNLTAEEWLLGAVLLAPAALEHAAGIVRPGDFFWHSHGLIYQACLTLHEAGQPVDALTVIDHLDKTGKLEAAGGDHRIYELAAQAPASANAPHWARIVREHAGLRELDRFGLEAQRYARERPGDLQQLVEQLTDQLAHVQTDTLDSGPPPEAVGAGEFIYGDLASGHTSIWGHDDQIAWASGEGLMLVGPDGVGKTTLGQQVALARAGIRTAVLGMTVTPDDRRVLYIAADRPRQALRSLARMVTHSQREQLDERLVVWRGPLPFLLNEQPRALAQLAKQLDAGTIIIDSLKDVALDISKDEAGARINYALQHVIAAGLELLVLHHQRKATSDNKRPNTLADVYGSRWLTAGMGSVISLWGDAGDPVVELTHIKQPLEELGPWNVIHDHTRGLSTLDKPPDLQDLLYRAGADGVTVTQAASLLFSTDAPDRNQREKARRRLDKLAETGVALRLPGVGSSPTGPNPDRYVTTGTST